MFSLTWYKADVKIAASEYIRLDLRCRSSALQEASAAEAGCHKQFTYELLTFTVFSTNPASVYTSVKQCELVPLGNES